MVFIEIEHYTNVYNCVTLHNYVTVTSLIRLADPLA